MTNETTKTDNSPTAAAKCIRADLKKAFPKIKFRVRTSYYAGGNSIDISWTNGPTGNAVDVIVKKYQYGTFDSMTDCAGYVEGFTGPGAKHVFVQRTVSEDIKTEVRARIAAQYSLTEAEAANNYNNRLPESMHTLIHRYLINLDLTNGLPSFAEMRAAAKEREAQREAEYAAYVAEQAAAKAQWAIEEAARLAADAYKANQPPALVILPRPARCAPSRWAFSTIAPTCHPTAWRFTKAVAK